MTPPAPVYGLVRHSTGLTEAHKQLIRMLAEKAVSDFLTEEAEINRQDRGQR